MNLRCSAFALIACVFLVAADEPAKKKFEPRSEPGAGQTYLARFAGQWEVTKTFHPREGAPVVTKGRCRQEMVRGGRFLQSDFTFDAPPGGTPTTGQGLIGFEPSSGRFTSVWTDSRQTRMSIRHSLEPFDGTKIVMRSASLDPKAPDPWTSRTVSTLKQGDDVLTHQQFTVNSDGSERLIMELVMTRVKSEQGLTKEKNGD
jgi:hypothetical protein